MRLRKINGRQDEFIKMEWKKREKKRNGTVFSNHPTRAHRKSYRKELQYKKLA
jgi:hypothetical protein